MWGSLITGGLLMATSGVTGLMTQSAVSDRDTALVEWRGALTVGNLESASDRFNQANDNAQSYATLSTVSLVGGALLLGYSAYSYLTLPSIKTSIKRNSKKKKNKKVALSLPESELKTESSSTSKWVLLPVLGEDLRGVGIWFDF